MSDFAKNLRYYRKQKHLTQGELAKMLHYGYTAIANYESGRNEPSLDILIRLAEILGITVDELIGTELKKEEKILFSSYQKLNENQKKMILDLMKTFHGTSEKR